eukprot:1132584-Prymnesium_polylepis.1
MTVATRRAGTLALPPRHPPPKEPAFGRNWEHTTAAVDLLRSVPTCFVPDPARAWRLAGSGYGVVSLPRSRAPTTLVTCVVIFGFEPYHSICSYENCSKLVEDNFLRSLETSRPDLKTTLVEY